MSAPRFRGAVLVADATDGVCLLILGFERPATQAEAVELVLHKASTDPGGTAWECAALTSDHPTWAPTWVSNGYALMEHPRALVLVMLPAGSAKAGCDDA